MAIIFFLLAIVFFFIYMHLHNSADKLEERFNNRPSTITSPSNDLFTNQKYAIINILTFAQGTNSISAYSNEANAIINKWLSILGLSKAEVEKQIRLAMSRPPEITIRTIRNSMVEIKDKSFVRLVYHDVKHIVQISGDEDAIKFINELFDDILTH